jgi:transcriptional regulator with XRE-family HTH domain
MAIGSRIRPIREALTLGRSEFAETCGIAKESLRAIEMGRQRPTEQLIEAIGEHWPQFAYWLVTGKEIPDAGQISPETETVRKNLQEEHKKAG